MSTILTERKRYNYNVGITQSTRSSLSQKKLNINPIIPASNIRDENNQVSKTIEVKEANRKIQELQAVNRKIIEDTTEQFKKLELDVQRVEKILEEKQSQVNVLEGDKQALKEQLHKITEEKQILIEAIFEKDLIIKEFEDKLKEFLKDSTVNKESQITETLETEMQTDPITETGFKNELNGFASKNRELEDELYEVKQELFDAQNKVKLLTQQFEAYKILKQIESVQDI